ncbi:MAG: YabP/YqfC family sporulation protein [Clostridiales bacterium]|nr:YabP/YqfC family sporulation protein [Clostridiales bacterium]
MNNSLSQCVADICGLELATLIGSYKYSVFGGHTVVLEGHKGIADYTADGISFSLGKSQLKIVGSNLHIKRLEKQFAVVVGKISGVEVVAYEK